MTNQERRNTQLKLDLIFEGYKNNVFFIQILIPWRARNNANGYTFWAWAICVKKSVILFFQRRDPHEINCNGFKNTPAFKAIYVFNSLNAWLLPLYFFRIIVLVNHTYHLLCFKIFNNDQKIYLVTNDDFMLLAVKTADRGILSRYRPAYFS